METTTTMSRTHRSLYYPAGYLLSGGAAMLIAPRFALRMFLATGEYGEVFPRFAAVLTLGLGLLVATVIRHRVVEMYAVIIGVRVFFCAGYVALYLQTRDPFFLTMLALVAPGFVATAVCYARDRAAASARAPAAARAAATVGAAS